jgi:glycerophosphoryl diester phosphodiesterase
MASSNPLPLRRIEPVFGLRTPILFAHRGGAQEKPESTIMSFEYALAEPRTDVLELDVQLTRDREMVVWHGPGLGNVRIVGVDDNPENRPRDRCKIGHFTWEQLCDKAWVADPPKKTDEPFTDLSKVPTDPARRLLRFTDFLAWLAPRPDVPLNIELKECFTKDDLSPFIAALTRAGERRRIVVASNRNEGLLAEFRRRTDGRYPTNLPAGPLLKAYLAQLPGWLGGQNLVHRAVEAPYPAWTTPERLIRQVREAGGSTFVFLTSFPLVKALDTLPLSDDYGRKVIDVLNRGVDGIMTDLPLRVRLIIDAWSQQHAAVAQPISDLRNEAVDRPAMP